MQIFVTGGTGYIGRAVVAALTGAGHDVVALNSSPDKREMLEGLGATPHAGGLADPGSYRKAAAAAHARVHMAFDYAAPRETDRIAVETLLAADGDEGGGCFVYTSGCWVLGDTGGEVAGEDAAVDEPAEIVSWRVGHERVVLAGAGPESATAVVRPGVVYGRGGGLTSHLFESATRSGAAEFVGAGRNHWSVVHVDDLAALYRRLVEGRARGVFHGVDGVPMRVEEVAREASSAAGAGGATRSVPVERAREKLGGVADALCLDQRLAAPRSLAFGWTPRRPSFAA
ncbi:MAG: NAD-dependent epimerase/dehydratase family protein, partial [Gemmatimonadota bacterium]